MYRYLFVVQYLDNRCYLESDRQNIENHVVNVNLALLVPFLR